MRLPWWSIYIDAELEDGGVQVVGDQAEELLPIGTLVGWDRVGPFPLASPVDESGNRLRVDNGPLSFRFAEKRLNTANVWARLKPRMIQWYQKPSNQFKFTVSPKDNRSAILSLLWIRVYMICVLAIIPLLMALNQFDPADGTVLTGDLKRVYLILNGIATCAGAFAIGIAIKTVYDCIQMSKYWRLSTIDQDGVDLEKKGQRLRVGWDQLSYSGDGFTHSRMKFNDEVSNTAQDIFWNKTHRISIPIQSRLGQPRPKLITVGFVIIGFISLFSGYGFHWVYHWLDVELLEGVPVVITSMCIFLWAILIWDHRFKLREWKKQMKVRESSSQ